MAKAAAKKIDLKKTVKKIAEKLVGKAVKPKEKAKSAPAPKMAAKAPAKKAPVVKAKAPVKSAPIKPASKASQKTNLKVVKTPETKAKATTVAHAKKKEAKVEVVVEAPVVVSRKDSLKFREPHEIFEADQKKLKLAEAQDDAEGEGKKEKKNKGVSFKIISGQEADKWKELNNKLKSQKARSYSMKEVYEAHIPIQHKVLGWGVILSVQNDRLEVLFQDGIKFLISNYQTR